MNKDQNTDKPKTEEILLRKLRKLKRLVDEKAWTQLDMVIGKKVVAA